MREVMVNGEDLNGLGWTIKSLMETNLENDKTWNRVKKLKGTLVVREPDADVCATVFFDRGRFSIESGAPNHPTAFLEAGFETLSELISREVGPVKALLTRKIKARGNLLKLLRMAEAMISPKE